MARLAIPAAVVLGALLALGAAFGGEEPAEKTDDDLPTQDLRAEGDERKRYLVHGPRKGAKAPREGWRVLYVLPGGDGSADFQGFVKNIRRQALSDEYVEVQLVAPRWTEDQPIVWPSAGVPLKEAKFTTEQFFDAVHKEVQKAFKVDPRSVFALGWSSGGPPVYALTLRDKTPVTGAYVAMSVFKRNELPRLESAKGKPFFIDHSPEDKVCPFRMAEEARDALTKAGAKVEFATYPGGHGWKGPIWERLKKGIAHLERVAAK